MVLAYDNGSCRITNEEGQKLECWTLNVDMASLGKVLAASMLMQTKPL